MVRIRKRVEDFVCARCGTAAQGTGTTNHCPACLTSRHVDVLPGDRAASCGGLMTAVRVFRYRSSWRLEHRCDQCGAVRRCTASPADSFEAILAVARKQTPPKHH